MPRTRLEKELRKIDESVKEMGMLVCRDLHDAMEALSNRDAHLAEETIKDDERINRMYSDLKELCVQTIALHQPVARDLRFIALTMDVAYNLERIADYADDIAGHVEHVSNYSTNLPEIEEMGVIASRITENACKSFLERDTDKEKDIMKDEERMDELFKEIFPSLMELVEKKPEKFILALNMVLVAKYLERIADHAVNIENRTKYVVLGDVESI